MVDILLCHSSQDMALQRFHQVLFNGFHRVIPVDAVSLYSNVQTLITSGLISAMPSEAHRMICKGSEGYFMGCDECLRN